VTLSIGLLQVGVFCNKQAKDIAKKRNTELQAERDALSATNQKYVKRAEEVFGAKLVAAEKRMRELEAEAQRTNTECIQLEENIRQFFHISGDGALKNFEAEII